MDPEQY